MNRSDLYRSLQEMDADILARSETQCTHKPIYRNMGILAASLAIILCIFGITHWFGSKTGKASASSWFVVTAYAKDGISTELNVNDGCFNSGGTGENLFGVDFPLFSFDLIPSNEKWRNSEEIYTGFDVVISYDGKLVGAKDEHVSMGSLFSTVGSQKLIGYSITGWFEKPTDITVQIIDKKSGEVVEAQTVHVSYNADMEAYRLTVKEVLINKK